MYPRLNDKNEDKDIHQPKKDVVSPAPKVSDGSSKKELKTQSVTHITSLVNAIQTKKLETIEKLFENLTPVQRRQLILKRDKFDLCAFHYACQYGNKQILAYITSHLNPIDVYELRISAPSPHRLAEFSSSLAIKDFNEVIQRHNSVFDVFDYHVRNLHRNDQDIENRRRDTRERAKCFIANLYQPLPDERFVAKEKMGGLWKSSQEYYDLCFNMMRNGTLQEYKECEAFFNDSRKIKLLRLTGDDMSIINSLFDRGPESTLTEDRPGFRAEDMVSHLSKPTIRAVSYLGPDITQESPAKLEEVDMSKSTLAMSSFLASRVPDRRLEKESKLVEKKPSSKLTTLIVA
ncbi:MAG: hypothetical protein ACYCQI_16045 [Gammaproteobacteria bacterium]